MGELLNKLAYSLQAGASGGLTSVSYARTLHCEYTHSARLSSHDALAVIKLTAGVKSSSRQHADVGTYWFAAVITNRYLLVVGFRYIP